MIRLVALRLGMMVFKNTSVSVSTNGTRVGVTLNHHDRNLLSWIPGLIGVVQHRDLIASLNMKNYVFKPNAPEFLQQFVLFRTP